MADVLYVHPAKHGVGTSYVGLGTPYLFMPVGVIALANLLRAEGYAVRGVNYPAELARDEGFDLRGWLAQSPDARVVLIDLHWYEHSFGAVEVARACKDVLPGAQVVVGGMTASIFADEIIAAHPCVDYVVRGDAEEPLLRLVRALCDRDTDAAGSIPNLTFRRGDVVHSKAQSFTLAPERFDALDFVDLGFLDDAASYRRLQFSVTGLTADEGPSPGHWLCNGRGCRSNCSFCGGGARAHATIFRRQGVLVRSPARVAADVAALAAQGVRQVSLTLDPAMVGDAYAEGLCREVRATGARPGLYNEAFGLPKPRFLADVAESFDVRYSEMALTLLSGSEDVRRRNGKSFSNRDFLRLLGSLSAIGLPIHVYFSLNLPGEDEKAFEQTLALAEAIVDSYPPHLLKLMNMLHTLDPLAPMAQQPARYGVTAEFRRFRDYYVYCRATPAARAGVVPVAMRGFRDARERPLRHMAERWDAFCARRGGGCYPVPPTW